MRMLTRLLCVFAVLVSVAFAESLDETRKKAESAEKIELRKKAEAGHVETQVELAVDYRYGINANLAESARWWTAAAEQGHVLA
jgi:TPR repeat protein